MLRDPFKATVPTGENPDVLGWRDMHSVLIESKTTRRDFLADRAKPFRIDPTLGMGDVRLYLAPPGVIAVEDLPEGWGLLIAHEKRIEIAGPHPRTYTCTFWGESRKRVDFRPLPFCGNKHAESIYLASALARQQRPALPVSQALEVVG